MVSSPEGDVMVMFTPSPLMHPVKSTRCLCRLVLSQCRKGGYVLNQGRMTFSPHGSPELKVSALALVLRA